MQRCKRAKLSVWPQLGLVLVTAVLAACALVDLVELPVVAPTATPAVDQAPVVPTSAAPSPTALAKKGGEFRAAATEDAVSFHPYQTTDAASARYQNLTYAAGLVRRDPRTLQFVPNMAEAWTVSPDGKTYSFKLRRDMKWSDGAPLTAQDFAWTFDQASRRANRFPYPERLANIAFYAAKDDYTLEIGLRDATCVALAMADVITPLPKHVWSTLDWSDPAKNPEIYSPSVVSGPFKLKEWKQRDHATFVRNDSFFRGAPNLDAYTIRIVPDPAVQLQMLQAGQVDSAPVGVDDYAQAKANSLLKEYDWDPAAATWDYIGFNLRRPFLQDLQVRNALAYAIPRQAIADQVLRNLAKPTFSIFSPSSPVYNPDVPHYDYNVETTKGKLQQAGYAWDANGKVIDGKGKPVKLRIVYNNGNPQHSQIASLARDQLQKLGLDTEATGMSLAALIEYLQTVPFDYDLYVLGWRAPIDPYFSVQVFDEHTNPDVNSGAYVNRDVDALFEQANHAPCGANAQKKAFGEIQKALAEDSPYIFLTYRVGYAFLNRRVVPNSPTALGIDYNPEQWYVNEP